eukprot:jgi/Botrbrau1/4097/Bobra.152_3s0046.1
MSALRRLTLKSLRNWKLRGEHGNEKFWSEGKNDPTGYLFSETPPPPGQSRKWEDWEAPWYFTLIASALILGIGLNSKPDTNLTTWAHEQAKKELEAEDGG